MSTEENKAIVRRYWEEVWNQGNLALLEELFAPEHIEGQRDFISKTLGAFSDSQVTIEDMIAEGDKVATRYSWRAVHTGVWDVALKGISMAIPPTGKQVWDQGIAISRVVDGRIVEMPSVWTQLELAQQMGALPAPAKATG